MFRIRQFVIAATVSLVSVSGALSQTLSALTGKWQCDTYVPVKNGRAQRSTRLPVGAMVFTFSPEGSWQLHTAKLDRTGTYTTNGSHLLMKNSDGSPYQDVTVEMRNKDSEMVMTSRTSVAVFEKM